MQMGFTLGINRGGGAAGFVWPTGRPGFWVAPWKTSNLWQTDDTSTPVTADGQSVGRLLDNSPNGHVFTQPLAAKPTYRTSGGLAWLNFNSDALISTAAIDFSGYNAVTIIAGIEKLSDAAAGTIFNVGAVNTEAGAFEMAAPSAISAPNYAIRVRGTVGTADYSVSTYTAPIRNEVTCVIDLTQASGSEASFTVDGAAPGSTAFANNAGDGPLANRVAAIGARAGTSIFLNGNIYELIVIGGTL